METLLRGCVTWALNAIYCDKLRKAHFKVLQRVLGFQRHADHTNPSYAKGPQNTKCESIDMTIRKRRFSLAGAMVRQNKGRLPSRVMFAADSRWEKNGTRWATEQPAQNPQRRPRRFSIHRRLGGRFSTAVGKLIPYCGGYMQQRRRASGPGGSSKQTNGSWPGGT